MFNLKYVEIEHKIIDKTKLKFYSQYDQRIEMTFTMMMSSYIQKST